MPPWSVEELVMAAVALKIKAPDLVRSRFTVAGSCARLVMSDVESISVKSAGTSNVTRDASSDDTAAQESLESDATHT